MKKWEYRVFESKRLGIEETLDEFGKQGWELVAIYEGSYYLKRETKEEGKKDESKK